MDMENMGEFIEELSFSSGRKLLKWKCLFPDEGLQIVFRVLKGSLSSDWLPSLSQIFIRTQCSFSTHLFMEVESEAGLYFRVRVANLFPWVLPRIDDKIQMELWRRLSSEVSVDRSVWQMCSLWGNANRLHSNVEFRWNCDDEKETGEMS